MERCGFCILGVHMGLYHGFPVGKHNLLPRIVSGWRVFVLSYRCQIQTVYNMAPQGQVSLFWNCVCHVFPKVYLGGISHGRSRDTHRESPQNCPGHIGHASKLFIGASWSYTVKSVNEARGVTSHKGPTIWKEFFRWYLPAVSLTRWGVAKQISLFDYGNFRDSAIWRKTDLRELAIFWQSSKSPCNHLVYHHHSS